MTTVVNCSVCGKFADPNLDNCPHCGAPVQASASSSRAVSKAPPHQCPNCDTPVQDGDIICVRCGTNLLTGHKIAEERVASEEPERSPRQRVILGGLAVLVIAIVGLSFWLFRDPLKEAERLSQEDILGAINVLQRYLESHENSEAQLFLGKLQWRSRNFVSAADAFEAAAQGDEQNEEASKLAIMALSKVPGEMARTRFLAAAHARVDNRPDDEQARFLFALALGSIDNQIGQIEELEKLVTQNAQGVPARQFLGIAHAIQGDYDKAADALSRVATGTGGDGASTGVGWAGDVSASLGLLANLDGRRQEAIGYLEDALERGTSIEREARTRLGLLHMANGEFEEAMPLLDAAVAGTQAPEATRFYQALCRQALNREALSEFEAIAGGQGPYAANAALQAAILYMKMSDNDLPRARASAQRVVDLGQPSARLYTVLGQIEAMAGDQVSAQNQFRRAIELDRNYPAAYLESGLLYINRGVISEGLRELEYYLSLVGPEVRGARRGEIELLVSQLKQTLGGMTEAQRPALF